MPSDFFTCIPRINENVTTRHLGDEAFIMNLTTVRTYSVNETAARVWRLIDGARTVDDIVGVVVSEYDVPERVCRLSVRKIINRFRDEQLVTFICPHA